MAKVIMVTGGSGFMGSNFIFHRFKATSDVLINYSKHTYAMNPKILRALEKTKRYVWITGDILDQALFSKIIRKYDVNWIIHFAASTHVDRSFVYPEEFFENNTRGTFRILEVLRHLNGKRPNLIHISTDEIFGDIPVGHSRETDSLKPRNPYSASKAAIEMFVNAWHETYKIPVIIIRPTNNYGPRQHPEKLIAKIITRCLANRPYTLYKGESIRDWLYVKDMSLGLDVLMKKGKMGGIYNIAGEEPKSVPEVNKIILEIMSKESLFRGYKEARHLDDQRYALDCSKLKKLGWKQQTRFKQGIRETIEWYENNKWFWKGVYSP